jgi:ubiquinol-cytochrome c reductase cytochrome c subunit
MISHAHPNIVSAAIRCARRVSLALLVAQAVNASAWGAAASPADAKKIFTQRCTACHTFGKGIKVGPDLKGVTQRRTHDWLLRFVRSSQSVIQSGDATAQQLFLQFKRQRMPDWTDLSEVQISALLDWLAAAGPEQKPIDERHAESATAAEVERGRALFAGVRPLTHGGLACAACHALGRDAALPGGGLGPDLSRAYERYQDVALTTFLKRPCFPRQPELGRAEYLTPDESFALKAYLRQAARPVDVPPTTANAKRGPP